MSVVVLGAVLAHMSSALTYSRSLIIGSPHWGSTFTSADESVLQYHQHPKSTVDIMAPSGCGTFDVGM